MILLFDFHNNTTARQCHDKNAGLGFAHLLFSGERCRLIVAFTDRSPLRSSMARPSTAFAINHYRALLTIIALYPQNPETLGIAL
jgi:hypothetical protein